MASKASGSAPSIASITNSQQPLVANTEQTKNAKPSRFSRLSSMLNPLHRRPKETEEEKAARLKEEKRKKDMIKQYGHPPLWAQERDRLDASGMKGATGGKRGMAVLGAYAAAGGAAGGA